MLALRVLSTVLYVLLFMRKTRRNNVVRILIRSCYSWALISQVSNAGSQLKEKSWPNHRSVRWFLAVLVASPGSHDVEYRPVFQRMCESSRIFHSANRATISKVCCTYTSQSSVWYVLGGTRESITKEVKSRGVVERLSLPVNHWQRTHPTRIRHHTD